MNGLNAHAAGATMEHAIRPVKAPAIHRMIPKLTR
jgi:hypothetical protein